MDYAERRDYANRFLSDTDPDLKIDFAEKTFRAADLAREILRGTDLGLQLCEALEEDTPMDVISGYEASLG